MQKHRTAARLGTAIVLANLAVNAIHGAAHAQLHIRLNAAEKLFVTAVIVVAPLAAMALLWSAGQRLGLVLLALSMAGSLVFGFQHHFVMPGPDHVGAQGLGIWAVMFAVTSWLLLLTEAAGAYVGVRFLIPNDPF